MSTASRACLRRLPSRQRALPPRGPRSTVGDGPPRSPTTCDSSSPVWGSLIVPSAVSASRPRRCSKSSIAFSIWAKVHASPSLPPSWPGRAKAELKLEVRSPEARKVFVRAPRRRPGGRSRRRAPCSRSRGRAHDLDVVIDRVVLKGGAERAGVTDSVEAGAQDRRRTACSSTRLKVARPIWMSERFRVHRLRHLTAAPSSRACSPSNGPHGACPRPATASASRTQN